MLAGVSRYDFRTLKMAKSEIFSNLVRGPSKAPRWFWLKEELSGMVSFDVLKSPEFILVSFLRLVIWSLLTLVSFLHPRTISLTEVGLRIVPRLTYPLVVSYNSLLVDLVLLLRDFCDRFQFLSSWWIYQ